MTVQTAEYTSATREYSESERCETQFYLFLIFVGFLCPILLIPYLLMLLLRAAWRMCFSQLDAARADQTPPPPRSMTAAAPPNDDGLSWWWLVGFMLFFVVAFYTFGAPPIVSLVYGSSTGSIVFLSIKFIDFLKKR